MDKEASKGEGEDGDDDGSEQDLHDQFDDIYDDIPEDSGKSSGDANIEEQMAMTSSSDSSVQPLYRSRRRIESSQSESSSTSVTRHSIHTADTLTTESLSSSLAVTGTKPGDEQAPPLGDNAKKVV